jgi:peptidoglycan/xylan/chitin deacetylase (PgdA/CDA1 family)
VIHRTPFFLPLLYPSLTWRKKTDAQELYLTFDDGPVPGATEFVLEELAKVNAKATFFCIGDNVVKHPRVFERIISEGHSIGNHTFHHLNGWKTSLKKYIDEIDLCNNALTESCQKPTWLFRPPYGRITRQQIKAIEGDYQIIMWDVLTMDYLKNLSPETCLRKSIQATRPGSIVVFHDSLKAEKNLRYVLPLYLQHFLEKGFAFKTL